MKIYTGTGDGGRTSLFSGERLAKNAARVAAYGDVDELCSFLGLVESQLPPGDERPEISAQLRRIQGCLFTVGALLATSPQSDDAKLLPAFGEEQVEWLEERIDRLEAELAELHSFILPGGHPAAAYAQVARTVCRRAEREIVGCAAAEGIVCERAVIGFVNRLSDYCFVLGRYLNRLTGTEDVVWHG